MDSRPITVGEYDRPRRGKYLAGIIANMKEYCASTIAYAEESWTSIVAFLLLGGVTILLMAFGVSFWLALTCGIIAASLFGLVASKMWK